MFRAILAATTGLVLTASGLAQAQPAGDGSTAGRASSAGRVHSGHVPDPARASATATNDGARFASPQAPAQAADPTLQQLEDFRSTATNLEIPNVPQEGRNADQIRKNLKPIKLPPGFKIDLYAIVPDARHIAVGPNAGVMYRWARARRTFTRSPTGTRPRRRRGQAVRPGGRLQGSERQSAFAGRHAVHRRAEPRTRLPGRASSSTRARTRPSRGRAAGQAHPRSEQSFNHSARVCRIGPDNKLYIALGQPYNVSPHGENADLYNKWGIGGIVRMDRDGKNREVFARGVRNSVGHRLRSEAGDLWFTDNQVDGMGDDQPPGELNRCDRGRARTSAFPGTAAATSRTKEYRRDPARRRRLPGVEDAPHAADLGMTFYSGKMFPESTRGGIFSAQHGSWNRTEAGRRPGHGDLSSSRTARPSRASRSPRAG